MILQLYGHGNAVPLRLIDTPLRSTTFTRRIPAMRWFLVKNACQSLWSACTLLMRINYLAESFPPGCGKIFHLEGAAGQVVRIWFMQIDSHGVGNGDFVLVLMDSNDLVAWADFTFAKDAQIKSAAAAGQETLGHVVAAELQVQLEAWNSRLRHDHFRCADRETVSEEDGILDEACCGEIFPEGAPGQIHARQLLLPVRIVL